VVTPENLVEEVLKQVGQRKPQQNSLAEMALGNIDGSTLNAVVAQLKSLLVVAEADKQEGTTTPTKPTTTPPQQPAVAPPSPPPNEKRPLKIALATTL